jgi:hypothetical protein
MTIRNPKQEGTILYDCIPQSGKCPNNCFQCYFNHPGFYAENPLVPTPEEVGDGIVRVNCGHDSNIEKDLVVETATRYKNFFFNTSIYDLDFPGPVVFTANREEENYFISPYDRGVRSIVAKYQNLMFIRLRVSSSNLKLVFKAIQQWNRFGIVVVLTFMRYYDRPPDTENYEIRTHILNKSWIPTRSFVVDRLMHLGAYDNPLVSMCGTIDSSYCRDCQNCVHYYWLAKRRMIEYKKLQR